ncbi:MAG: TetR/AcrR family transcriptional regulator [Rhodobacteraceae bacterium]|nr:TetR/AcrR family transcriptional regulator [Paracoccaceae bacterium]
MILDAAQQVLLAQGVQGATMQAVACAAGMSKRTVYTVFDGREALFSALIRRLRETFIAPLALDQQALPLPDRLRLLLAPERGACTDEVPLEVLRAVVAEAPRHPSMAESFLEEGPRAIRRLIQAELERAVARGEIALADPAAAAALLHNMALPCPFEKLLSGAQAMPAPEEVRARVDHAVAVFLNGAAGAERAPVAVTAVSDATP